MTLESSHFKIRSEKGSIHVNVEGQTKGPAMYSTLYLVGVVDSLTQCQQ